MSENISTCKFSNESNKKKILVIGGTRGIGLEFVINAVGSGFPVLLIARNPEKFNYHHEKLEIVKGNLLDYDSLISALNAVENIVLSVGINPTFKTVNMFSDGTSNLIKAMNQKGVKNLFCITGIGAGDSRGLGGFMYNKIILKTILKSMYQDKDRQEEIIKNSSLNWVLIRPGYLTNGKLTEKYKIYEQYNSNTKVGAISRADVGDFILKAIISGKYFGKSVVLSSKL